MFGSWPNHDSKLYQIDFDWCSHVSGGIGDATSDKIVSVTSGSIDENEAQVRDLVDLKRLILHACSAQAKCPRDRSRKKLEQKIWIKIWRVDLRIRSRKKLCGAFLRSSCQNGTLTSRINSGTAWHQQSVAQLCTATRRGRTTV